jgi:TolB-like protein/Tfp pilus assembly protein PilF
MDSSSTHSANTLLLSQSRVSFTQQFEDLLPSIAVLPFVNMSADPENDYFCDGLAEELLNALSKIDGLKVAARTSAFSFKGKNVDVREIGRLLSVSVILEGSVRKADEHLRISAQLINAADGYRLWSERYDRKLADIFGVQDEISLAIVEGLKLKLLGEDRAALFKKYTDNGEAYHLYLKGRYHQNKWTGEGIRKSVEYFEQAIAIDPNYALAYAGLADSYASLSAQNAFGLSVTETAPIARTAAMKALEIDNNLAEAHQSLGLVKLNFDWDWTGAENAFKRALELNPNSAHACHWYSHLLIAMDRFDESFTASKRAIELNPLDLDMNIHLAWHYFFARNYDLTLEVARKTLEMDSTFTDAFSFIGWACVQKGQFEEAIDAYHQSRTLREKHEQLAWLGHAYALLGNQAEARRCIAELDSASTERYVSPYWISLIYLGLKEKDKTFEYLQRAFDERNAWLVYLNVNPVFDSLRSDARFDELLKRLGLTSADSRSAAAQQLSIKT